MRQALIKRLASQYLLPKLDDFRVHDNYMYMRPIGNIIRAILFESSPSGAEHFYVRYFFHPMFVPFDHLPLSYGNRFSGIASIYIKEAEIQIMEGILDAVRRVGIPFLQAIQTPKQMIKFILQRHEKYNLLKKPLGIHELEAIGYAFVLCRQFDDAKQYLDQHGETAKHEPDWALERVVYSSQIRKLLDTNPEGAITLLN
ncbi:MAG: hypothetical protein ACRDF4_10610, partial [Rhabdochlamydiaceae bacterium]